MEMASAWGFVRTLLIIILCYYAFKFLMRIFAPILMQKAVSKMQQKMQEQYRQQQEQQQDRTSQSQQSMPKEKKKVGEYIDYEEIK
jgi:predicted Holliday junction resolvase-like endonuclease